MSMYESGHQFAVSLNAAFNVAEDIAQYYSDEQIESLIEDVQRIESYGGETKDPFVELYTGITDQNIRKVYEDFPELIWGAELIAGNYMEDMDDWEDPVKMSVISADDTEIVDRLAEEYEKTVG